MPVNATRFLRKMRGGAQAHLLATDAPGPAPFYVTKFTTNPQHRRVLINEWLGAHLLSALGIATPRVAVVTLSAPFLAATPDIYLETGSARSPVPPGWHLGSQFPGDPLTEAVYDYLPDSLLPSVANRPDFLGVLAFDKWCGNADARQAIFLRRRLRDWLPNHDSSSPRKGFIAQMIDHGYLFDGPNWCYRDAPLQGFYPRPAIYDSVRSLDDFEPWLSRVRHCPESAIDDALRSLPPGWIEGDDDALSALLEQLLRRRARVPDLLLDAIRARPAFFPAWRG
jgi:hypothetical protein